MRKSGGLIVGIHFVAIFVTISSVQANVIKGDPITGE